MKAYLPLLALTLGLASVAACSSGDTTTTSTSGTSSGGAASTAATTTGGTGGAGGSASSTTSAGGGAASSSGSSSSTASATSSSSGGMEAFALTSTGFSEGMVIPDKYACNNGPGSDSSPDLSWTAGPTGTLSYAVVLTDKSNGFLHWVIWDIPVATTSLPAGVEKKANPAVPAGSKQVKSFDGQTFGYRGPCPPDTHTYEFAVFALDVATLPNVTTASSRAQVDAEILNHDLGSATLAGTYTP